MENLYKRLLEFTRDSVHRYTFADGTIQMANQGFVDFLDLDCKPEEVVGKRVGDLIEYVEEPGTIRAALEKKGEIHGFEYRFRTLKGEDRWVVHDSFLTTDPETGEKVVEAITRDITLRKVTEQSLRESEAKYRNLVENARDGICIIQEGNLVYVNQRLAEMTGHSVDDVIGTAFLDYVDPVEVARATEAYEQMLRDEAETQRLDTLLRNREGQRIDVAINAGVIPYEGGQAALLMIRDVTEEKRWQEALRENERIETIRTLARGVAHSFNNIIGVIQGYAVSITDNLLPETRPHQYSKRIGDAARHALHLTERLTSVAEVTEGSLRANVKTVPLNEVVADAVDLVEHAFSDKGIRVEVKGSEMMPAVHADRSQLFDALMSVIINASEAMPGGGSVVIDHVERKIARPRVNPVADGGVFVGLRIRDSGEGMSRDLVRKIFDPFFTTKQDPSAFGLGLTMARTMLVGMGGWIDVRSREGRGTVVRFYMPKVVDAAKLEEDTTEDRKEGTILLADDDEDARRIVAEALEATGYTVLNASNGEEAVGLHAENADDIKVAVIDMIMPGTDGEHALEGILKRKPDARIVLTSGFSRDYVRGRFPSGAWSFLQKPYTPNRLVDLVDSLLVKKQVSGSADG